MTVTSNTADWPRVTDCDAGDAASENVGSAGGVGPHDVNLNDPTRVLQLNVPFACRYSLVYQNVQSSTGSIVIEL